ncbi:unnamed protein product [Paramecium octaurelia]|uniref:Uncharacterized protein n=1 Tax=Paramecium octaurelia TaxID=43137 RepID=A0A8S1VNZ6_PAROT|nr:unnamed protein product [Paramecium octaurelia]
MMSQMACPEDFSPKPILPPEGLRQTQNEHDGIEGISKKRKSVISVAFIEYFHRLEKIIYQVLQVTPGHLHVQYLKLQKELTVKCVKLDAFNQKIQQPILYRTFNNVDMCCFYKIIKETLHRMQT